MSVRSAKPKVSIASPTWLWIAALKSLGISTSSGSSSAPLKTFDAVVVTLVDVFVATWVVFAGCFLAAPATAVAVESTVVGATVVVV